MSLTVKATRLPEVLEILPARFEDHRGWFSETWNRERMAAHGLDLDFIQDNQSLTRVPGAVRGLHFQRPPNAQGKLVRAVAGAVFDVAVDIRAGSPRFGQWVGVRLDAATGNQLWVPEGFAHGFMALEPDSEIAYKITGRYSKADEGSIRFDDPSIGIDWPMPARRDCLSAADANAAMLADANTGFVWQGEAE